jgi:hypothetical protein
MSLRKNKAAASSQSDELIDGLVDDFRHEEDPSVAESSVLSSIFPIVRPSQVRANAPRADMPSTNHNQGGRAFAKKNEFSIPKDVDSLTVDTGRPIDSVYIYPTEPQSNSLQRRTYKSGNRSVLSGGSRGSGSGGGAAGSVGGILDTLGLGGDGLDNEYHDDDDDDGDDTTEGDFSRGQRSSSSRGIQPRHLQSRRPTRTNSAGATGTGPQVHLRAFVVLFLLSGILYGAFQWVVLLQSNNRLVQSKFRRSKSKVKKKYKAFGEGEDRPLPEMMRGRLNGGDPTFTAKQLAAVPQKDSYKDKYLGRNEENAASPAKTTEEEGADETNLDTRDEEEAADNLDEISGRTSAKSQNEDVAPHNDDKPRPIDKEDAPVDTLQKIDESDPDKGMSLSVQAGLSSIYTKDPTRKDTPFLWYIPRSGVSNWANAQRSLS